jgi:hypothetical protein
MEHRYWKDSPLTPKYSDVESEEFWKYVNSLDQPEQSEMYLAGVLLQNMEEQILHLLNNHIRDNITKTESKPEVKAP